MKPITLSGSPKPSSYPVTVEGTDRAKWSTSSLSVLFAETYASEDAPAIVTDRQMERGIASLVLRIHQGIRSQISFAQLSIAILRRPVKQALPTLHDHAN